MIKYVSFQLIYVSQKWHDSDKFKGNDFLPMARSGINFELLDFKTNDQIPKLTPLIAWNMNGETPLANIKHQFIYLQYSNLYFVI